MEAVGTFQQLCVLMVISGYLYQFSLFVVFGVTRMSSRER